MMSEKEKKVPRRRFKEFEGAEGWERRKLGELGEFKNGMNFSKDAMGHGYPFVNLQNVFGRNIVEDVDLGLAESTDAQRKDYNLQKGDVLFIRSSVKPEGVGEAAIVPKTLENTTYSGFIIRFRPFESMSARFNAVVYSTKTIRNQILMGATSSANTNINQEALQKIRVSIPKIKEQEQVGTFFNKLDNLITLHQRKLEKMKALKKAYLTEMFPAEGECKPRLRFAGFTEDWEQRKFLELFTTLQNSALSRAELSDEQGVAMNVHYGDVLIKFGECLNVSKEKLPFIIDDTCVSKYKASFLKNCDVIIADAAEDETVGKCSEIVGLTTQTVISGLHTIPCRPIQVFASGYLGYYMNSNAYHDQLLPLIQGTKVSSISRSALNDTVLIYPKSNEEQTLIASFFTNLDNLITLHQHKLEKLQNIKKAYLNEMFI